jgi:inorganic pyrophosphatase
MIRRRRKISSLVRHGVGRNYALLSWRLIGENAPDNPHPDPAMNIDAIPIGSNPPDDLNVIIEVPLGGEPIKYEIDKASGALFVDRFLYTPMRYPGNYGFVPHTLCGDGDPLDVIVMNSRPLVPGAVVRCRPIGVLFMEDDGGKDEKVLAVPAHKLTAMYDHIHDIGDIQPIQIEKVKHFFTHYKDLEPGKWVKLDRIGNAAEARQVVLDSIEMGRSTK